MKKNIEQANIYIKAISIQLKLGKITYDESKTLTKDAIKLLNDEAKKVAKSFGRKFYPVTFSGLMR